MLASLDRGIVTCGLIIEDLYELDDVLVGREKLECLDFLEFLYFFNSFIFFLHALDGHQLVVFDGLRHEDLGKGALAFLGLETVLVHS